jgi:hypothetical protein
MGARIAAAAAIGVALSVASVAGATTVITTYTGTVKDGGDATFGPDLNGNAFKAVFTSNISIPGEELITPTEDEVSGGTDTMGGLPSPTSAVITINGVTYQDSGVVIGSDLVITNRGVASDATDGLLSADIGVQTGAPVALFKKNLANPLTYVPVSGDDGFGLILNGDATGRIDLDTTSITVALAAPEPMTWALLLAGVFGIAAALRTRSTQRPAKA